MAERLGPPANLRPVSTENLRIAEIPFLTQVNLRVDPKSRAAAEIGLALGVPLPTEPGTYVSGDADVLWMGPDEWLVIGPPAPGAGPGAGGGLSTAVTPGGSDRAGRSRAVLNQDDLEVRLREAANGAHVSVTDVSAQRTALLVGGSRARDLLAHGCALDLHPRVFGPGRCAQTMLARAHVVLAAREGDEFIVLVRSSFAGYLAAWLLDAATEYLT
jgi:sarcosine oxidase subunit gamma